MIYWSAVCFIIAITTAGFTLTTMDTDMIVVGKVLFFLFAILFVLFGTSALVHRGTCGR